MPPKKQQIISDASVSQNQDPNNENQFETELSWCIRQLELGICNKTGETRQVTEAIKVLKILRSDKAPLVKKRQAMRNTFGDYRQKIKEEEKKNATKMKKLKVTPVSISSQSKSVFYKKSLKKADDSYVTMMASVNVNSDEIIGTATGIKQEAPCGFKFGFPIPTSCDSKTEIDNKMTVKSDIDGTDTCQGHDIVTCHSDDIKCEGSDIITTKFVMPKTDNNFRFNFDLPP